jgi:hypothetical protein
MVENIGSSPILPTIWNNGVGGLAQMSEEHWVFVQLEVIPQNIIPS